MPAIPKSHIFDVIPDWVCEVISPSSGRLDRIKKMPIYAREGVLHAWIVDPEQQVLEVRTLRDGRWSLQEYGSEDKVRLAPFEAIEIDLTLVWGPAQ